MVCPSCSAPVDAASGFCPQCSSSAGLRRHDTTAPGADPDVTRRGGASDHVQTGAGAAAFLPGQSLTRRYTILKLLGTGGMGEVYQAWDEVVGTAVALKIIRPQAIAETGDQQLEERFRRELRLARQVTHPNVIRIHDIGELGDTRFLTMEFVKGADLGQVLGRAGALALPRALSIARQVASGLAAVHAAGVIHRDLKPANIILDEQDCAHVTDFGIARALDAQTLHTLPGSVIGTLAYMSPEQARGESTDQRSDVYAFGLIVYEMIAGGRPKSGSESALASLIERLQKGPPPLGTLVPDVPVEVERIVMRCLAGDPAERYGSFQDVLADLERLGLDGHALVAVQGGRRGSRVWVAVSAAASAGLVTAAAILWLNGARSSVTPVAHEPMTILISDFTNAAQDPVFDGSLEQALGVSIEGASFITTFPRRAGARLKEADARLLAVREGIAVVLSGTIRRAEGGYEVTVKALNPASGEVGASASARAPSKGEVLQAVGTVAAQLRRSLGDTSPPSQLKAETFTAGTLEAMKSYTTAQELSTNRKNDEAIQYYKKAIDQDPTFGRAYAGWATAAFDSGRQEEGRQMWAKALTLVDSMTERERDRTLGTYFLLVEHNTEKAIENYEKLVRLYPADLAGHNNLAVAYFSTRRFSDALKEGRRAIDVLPRSLKYRGNFALYAMYASDFKNGADSARALLEENPTYVVAYLPLATEALVSGKIAEAKKVYERVAAQGAEGASFAAIGLADIALFEGRHADAVAILPPAIEADRSQKNTVGAAAKTIALAEAYSGLGRTPQVLKTIDEALALSREDATIVPAARLLLLAGADERARALIQELSARLPTQSRAYARILEGELEMAVGPTRRGEAMDALEAANKLADLWLGRFAKGVAYEKLFDQHVAARDEFERCTQRLGEASALFLDDVPTFRYTAQLRQWSGRVRQAPAGTPATTPR